MYRNIRIIYPALSMYIISSTLLIVFNHHTATISDLLHKPRGQRQTSMTNRRGKIKSQHNWYKNFNHRADVNNFENLHYWTFAS